MSGIYIKGMEMPFGESEKLLIVLNRDGEAVAYRVYNYDPHDEEPLPAWYEGRKCEAIEVPDHGRLIDADWLDQWYACDEPEWDDMHVPIGVIRQNIKDTPTIIPGDKEDDDERP